MKQAGGGPSTRKSYIVHLYIVQDKQKRKRKLKVPLLKQTVRVHRKSPYLGLTPLVMGEILYQGEDSRVHVETTLGFFLYFGSLFWVYREETPVE